VYPEEAWDGKPCNVSYFRIFGCVAFAHVPAEIRRKLDDRSERCIFVGYSEESRAYRLYNPIAKKYVINRDVQFKKNEAWDGSIARSGGPKAYSRFSQFDTYSFVLYLCWVFVNVKPQIPISLISHPGLACKMCVEFFCFTKCRNPKCWANNPFTFRDSTINVVFFFLCSVFVIIEILSMISLRFPHKLEFFV
jgi:hypothetical protein